MNFAGSMKAYRIGWGRGWRRRRPWQSEAPGACQFARRAFTAKGAERKMRRDVAFVEKHGRPSLAQRRLIAMRSLRYRVGAVICRLRDHQYPTHCAVDVTHCHRCWELIWVGGEQAIHARLAQRRDAA